MIKLTIAIPTYNRPDYIQRQVRDILPQLRDGVSLIVYDNCSDIPVDSLFSKEENGMFTIVRNSFNIGGLANFGKCMVENGDSGWMWLPGDDDKIADNAVDIILSTIESHSNCCYINFQQKKDCLTDDFYEFLQYFRILGAFGISFFQSACLFNMDKLKSYVMYYYEFLSSWVGQIVMVIKYLESNKKEQCLFTTDRILIDNSAGGWSPFAFIRNSSMLIDRFHYLRPIMKSTLFKALGDTDFTMLVRSSSGNREKIRSCWFLIKKLGWFNVLRYNYVTFGQYVLSVLMPKGSFDKLRANIADKYNKKVKK